jgi:putative heme transporter
LGDGKESGSATGAGRSLADQEPVPVPRSQVRPKTIVTICGVVALAAGLIWLFVHSIVSLTLCVVSALLAVSLNHTVERLRAWHVPRGMGVALVMTGLVGAMAGLVWLVVPASVRQVQEVAERAPELVERVKRSQSYRWLDDHADIEKRIEKARAEGGGLSTQSMNPVFAALGGVLSGLAALVTVLFLTIFMLLYGGSVVRGILAETLPKHRERYERVLKKIDTSVGGYLSGLCFIAIVNTALTSAFLAILKVPLFLPLGIVSGIGSFLPLVGVTVSGVAIAAVTLAAIGPWGAVAAIAYICVYQQFENHVLTPLVYRKTVSLNPLMTIVGLVFMAEIGGVVGAFLAVPLASAVQIVLKELLLLRREHLGLPLTGDVARISRWPFLRRPRHA